MAVSWGIIGTGKIAKRFAADLAHVPDAVLLGAAGRNFGNTKAFCEEFNARPFLTVEELLATDVQVIYVATPHSEHFPMTMKALGSGKAVLCEKPFAMTADEARKMIHFAAEKDLYLMEAMWTRFFPAIEEIIELVKSGAIGEIVSIESSFGFRSEFAPGSRLYEKSLGGGSILDVGVYCLALTRMLVAGEPLSVTGTATYSSTDVDLTAEWEMVFPSGARSKGRSSIISTLENEARIVGTKGEIRIPKFWCPKEYFLSGERKEFPFEGMGFQFEAREVMKCLERGERESRKQPLQDTLSVMTWIDTLLLTVGHDRQVPG